MAKFKFSGPVVAHTVDLVRTGSKQFRFQLVARERIAAYLHETHSRTYGKLMNQARCCLLAASLFTNDQYRNVHLRQQFSLSAQPFHYGTGSHERQAVTNSFDLISTNGCVVLVGRGPVTLQHTVQLLLLPRLEQKILRP